MLAPAKGKIQQDLARRIAALGGDVGDVEQITHDDRSLIRILEGIVGLLEKNREKNRA